MRENALSCGGKPPQGAVDGLLDEGKDDFLAPTPGDEGLAL